MKEKDIRISSCFQYDGTCRDGFNHYGFLYINEELVSRVKAHYINRTWERYEGQSVRKSACYEWMESHKNEIKDSVKAELGLKRATPKVYAELERRLAEDETYKLVEEHYKSL